MSQQSPQPIVDPRDEELTAYLDGELDEPARIAVEQRLGDDQTYRQRLQSLERAWDLLDLLPSSPASEDFTRTTVAMTVETAAEQAETQQLQLRRKRNYSYLLGVAVAVAMIACGYGVAMLILDAPNRQLVRDLPVIESVDQLHTVEDVEFLQQLADEGFFVESEEVSDNAP